MLLLALEDITDNTNVGGDDNGVQDKEEQLQDRQEEEITTDVPEETIETPTSYNIDGEEFSIDQLREFRNSGLRRDDYSKKIQEANRISQEAKDALELQNYLKSNPELLKALREKEESLGLNKEKKIDALDPVKSEINELKQQLRVQAIEKELSDIMAKDPSVKDIELLQTANELKVDLRTAYYYNKGKNADAYIKAEVAKMKEQLLQEIKTNNTTTKTLITNGDVTNDTDTNYGLSEVEKAMATKLGMEYSEYAKYKNPNYRE